ncbi:Multidrug resistance protein [Cytospora paraplurivora]|uniref:Multidrug resistance protein n=1 Tax=Cytospora paraplurivora TaxID=2898453 RepID=A0AAN9TW98_9PEZI
MEQSTRDSAFRDWLVRKQSQARLCLGLAFNNLHVHGFVSSARLQPTVVSYALAIPRLAWKLLSRQSDQRIQILHGIDGLISSGEMLLVLGRPGSGCTTFLKALAGDTHGIFIGDESDINYGGLDFERMHRDFKGESIYLAEVDVHFPELTLGQTLNFALSTRELGPQRNAISQKMSRDLSTLFDLDNAFDTWMGSAMIRGVSGGEKRRTSIAEAIASGAQVQLWDNSTRGLDSATALRFIELLRRFDKVTLLYEGRQIYFGPIDSAAQYFYDLGFERPLRATTPDFLTSLTNPEERITRAGFEDKVPRSPDEFANAWKQSAQARQLLSDIAAFNLSHPPMTTKTGTSQEKVELESKLSGDSKDYAISPAQ